VEESDNSATHGCTLSSPACFGKLFDAGGFASSRVQRGARTFLSAATFNSESCSIFLNRWNNRELLWTGMSARRE
jgi:hypothetical protein